MPGAIVHTDSPLGLQRTSVREQLETRKKHHEQAAKDCDEALKLLDDNPSLVRLYDLFARVM